MPSDAPDLTPARLEELLAAASPGPWHVDGFNLSVIIRRADGQSSWREWANVAQCDRPPSFRNANWRADAALIALSPALAARVIELQAENARLTKALRAIASHGNNCGCHQATFINIARAALGPGHD